jgi:hypothetical protein
MHLPVFDRMDFWLTKAVLALVGVAVPVLAVGLPLTTWWRGEPLRWDLDGLGDSGAPEGLVPAEGVRLRTTHAVVVQIDDPGTVPWLASLLPGVLLSVAVGLAVWLLLRLVRRIEQGKPFVVASAMALRLLGATILLGSLAVSLGLGVADSVIGQRAVDGADLLFTFEVPFLAFIGALVTLALAEAFVQAARLQDDVEGLV